MIDERTAEILAERLVNRVEQANTYFLMKLGASIKKIRNLTPTEAQQLVQILRYGGTYDEILEEISKYTNLNVKDIDEIISAYAKKDMAFYEKFYEYRNIPFLESTALKQQREAFTQIVKNEMYNYTRNNVLGYTIYDILPNGQKGKPVFYGLTETYNRVLDEALVSISQGKETFDSAMARILEDIGGSGLKTLNYESGRAIRLDSATRMHLKGRLRELHNERQKIIGEEIDYDGWEISVHANPAPDHQEAQGRQFSIEEYEKLQRGEEATDYKGKKVNLDHDGKNGYRPISEMNCYHTAFTIVLGVSKPLNSDAKLKRIIDNNNEGFEFEGKHYTNYEGTQLQRSIEREIRKQKDTQILAKASGNKELLDKAERKITILTRKYGELNKISKLPPKPARLNVSGFKKSKS